MRKEVASVSPYAWLDALEKETKKDWLSVADEIDRLQAVENQGRGVSCARSIVTYLRRGNIRSAGAISMNEYDKLRSYPVIWKYLLDQGLRVKEMFEK